MALQNEIDILTQVDHPNIVKLSEIYEDDDTYYLVMELMLGGEVYLGDHVIVVRLNYGEGIL